MNKVDKDITETKGLKEININENFLWDILVRLTHWGVAGAVLLNTFVVEEGETAHEYLGYFAVFLVAVRLLWGVSFAKNEARLSKLKPSIIEIKEHITDIKSGKESHTGHNPLAALSAVGLWVLIIFSGFTGYITTTDWGIENDFIEDVHEFFANFLMIMVYLHLIGIAVTSYIFKRNIVKTMIFNKNSKD